MSDRRRPDNDKRPTASTRVCQTEPRALPHGPINRIDVQPEKARQQPLRWQRIALPQRTLRYRLLDGGNKREVSRAGSLSQIGNPESHFSDLIENETNGTGHAIAVAARQTGTAVRRN